MVLHAVVAGHEVVLDSEQVVRSLSRVRPEPVRKHYVVVASKRIPVRQALSVVTGIDKAEFQSHQARSIFRRLGLPTGQLGRDTAVAPASPRPSASPSTTVAQLRRYAGYYVAVRGGRVLYSAASPLDVIAWLRESGLVADTVFRVPVDPAADLPKLDL